MTTDAYDHDVREFGLHVRQGGWRLGLLVARNVERSKPGPKIVSAETNSKVSATEFARDAGTSNDRVLRYLDAWEMAAADQIVPSAAALNFGVEVPLDVDQLPSWDIYYSRAVRAARVKAGRAARKRALEQERTAVQQQAQAAADYIRSAHYADALTLQLAADQLMAQSAAARERGTEERPVPKAEAGPARSIDRELNAEFTELTRAIQSYTRRLFDVARDRAWVKRGERADEVRHLAEQLHLVAGIVADPDAGHVTDTALSELLNGK
jgi:hypothetical protein